MTAAGTETETVGQNMRRLRESEGWSQTLLADLMTERFERAGVNRAWFQNTVSRVENGRQRLDLGEVKLLSELLGDVTEGTDVREPIGSVERSLLLGEVRRTREDLQPVIDRLDRLEVLLSQPEPVASN